MRGLILGVAMLGLVGCSVKLNDNKGGDGYRLVWCEEFNKDGALDPEDWNFEKGFARNNEHQWYQEENAVCRGGMLVIEARREKRPNPTYQQGARDWRRSREFIEYTSSSVTTSKKHEFLYGRFEIRARIDTRMGSWPAFWTLGVKGPWPACGEVDIMEYYDGSMLANVAWAGSGGGGDSGSFWNEWKRPITDLGPAGWEKKFHVWRMDWDENSIKLYCDGKLLNSQDLSQTINDPKRRGDAPENPFRQPMYLLLNQAIGGRRGGDPSKTAFPVRYEIDYVRVWQKG